MKIEDFLKKIVIYKGSVFFKSDGVLCACPTLIDGTICLESICAVDIVRCSEDKEDEKRLKEIEKYLEC